MIDQEIHQVELSIEEARKIIGRGEVVDRLTRNKDFEEVFTKGYLVDEASRLTLLLGDPMLNKEQQEMVITDLKAIGSFLRYVQNISRMANQAKSDLADHQFTLDELYAEQDADADGEGEVVVNG